MKKFKVNSKKFDKFLEEKGISGKSYFEENNLKKDLTIEMFYSYKSRGKPLRENNKYFELFNKINVLEEFEQKEQFEKVEIDFKKAKIFFIENDISNLEFLNKKSLENGEYYSLNSFRDLLYKNKKLTKQSKYYKLFKEIGAIKKEEHEGAN